MHGLVIALLTQIFVVEYLVERRGLLHPYFVLIPELLSAIVMLVVLLRLMNGARCYFDWRYGVFLLVLLFTIAFGYAVQDVPTGAMLAGVRSYVKFLPFFLLPAVHRFTPRQLQTQLAFLLVLAVLQTPLAFYQRFVEFAASMHTGDQVRGTLTTSSALSMFLICAIAGVVVAYLHGRIRLAKMLGLAAWLFAATTINETKATLLLLPIALVVPALTMPGKGHVVRRLLPIAAVAALGVTAFGLVYNYMMADYASPISEFFTNTDRLTYYLYTGAANTDQPYVGRFDSIEIALEHTTQDAVTLAFGFGAGNVSESFLPEFDGKYADYYLRFGVGQTQVTQWLWEIGFVGLLTYLFLFYLVFRDSLTVARSKDVMAPVGQLWTVAMIVVTFGLIYKSVFSMNDFAYPFWYFAGVVASRAVVVRQAARKRVRQLPPSWRLAAGEPRAPSGPDGGVAWR
jgi:hypothetical protein